MTDINKTNGRWTTLFRALIAAIAFCLPFIIAMAVWSTTTLFQVKEDIAIIKTHNEYLVADFRELKMEVKELKKMQEEVMKIHTDVQDSFIFN